jgi:hypothetical protein
MQRATARTRGPPGFGVGHDGTAEIFIRDVGDGGIRVRRE